jgi:CTP synthase
LREIGIQPDFILCRSTVPLDDAMRKKIALFTNVEDRAVISAHDVAHTIYEIPLMYRKQNFDDLLLEKLNFKAPQAKLKQWEQLVNTLINAKKSVKIGIVGKYLDLHDSYKSIFEALTHGGIANECKVELIKIDSEELEKNNQSREVLLNVDGILVPGGFGQRGIEGKIYATHLARTHKIPCFGVCLGMQVMVIEYARHVLNLKDANSTEIDPKAEHPVVCLLEEQIDVKAFGGTMRLGRSESILKKGTRIYSIYDRESIFERHRHRYEISNNYVEALQKAGLTISGMTPDNKLVESVEWPDHPWGIGVQFHPEFTSKPVAVNPLFKSFIKACITYAEK